MTANSSANLEAISGPGVRSRRAVTDTIFPTKYQDSAPYFARPCISRLALGCVIHFWESGRCSGRVYCKELHQILTRA